MPIRFRLLFLLGAALVVTSGCSSQDPVGIRINLSKGGSGTIAVAALSLPEISKEIAEDSGGVDWTMNARLAVTSGDFKELDGVSIEDLKIRAKDFGADGGGTIRIRIPCGSKASWFRSLHVSTADRSLLQTALRQSITEIDLHENVTISVTVADARVAGALVDPIPRVTIGSKQGTCTLVVPIEILESRTDPMVLVLNWERSGPASTR